METGGKPFTEDEQHLAAVQLPFHLQNSIQHGEVHTQADVTL
jgi:hypothetical protein